MQDQLAQIEELVASAQERADALAAQEEQRPGLSPQGEFSSGPRFYGAVTNAEIADAIKEARGFEVDKRKVHLGEPIKHTGTYQIDVDLAEGVRASVKVLVTEG